MKNLEWWRRFKSIDTSKSFTKRSERDSRTTKQNEWLSKKSLRQKKLTSVGCKYFKLGNRNVWLTIIWLKLKLMSYSGMYLFFSTWTASSLLISKLVLRLGIQRQVKLLQYLLILLFILSSIKIIAITRPIVKQRWKICEVQRNIKVLIPTLIKLKRKGTIWI